MTFRAQLAVVTVAETNAGLADTLSSLQDQTDTRWQWCLVAVGADLYDELFRWAAGEPRVLVLDGSALPPAERDGAALALADADYVCRLAPGDRLDAGLVSRLRSLPEGWWAYTDEAAAHVDDMGLEIWFKPEFCPELVRSQPYPVRSAMLPLAVVRSVGGLTPAAGTAQWYDLVLRVWEKLGEPEHLTGPYYIRAESAQPAPTPWIDGTAEDRCRAVGRHCDRIGIEFTEVVGVEAGGRPLGQRLVRRLRGEPKISLVIPTRGSSSLIYGLQRCHVVEMVRSLWVDTRYPNLELVVVYDTDTPASVLGELREITGGEVVLLPFSEPFHFSRKCNKGALVATGEYLCFLNDDMQVRTPDWLHEMATLLQDPTVGAVGPKLLFADGTLQHAGHTYNGGKPGHLLFGHAADSNEMGGIAQLVGERSGVTGACMLVRAAEFADLGGFSDLFPLNYNDVDLCLKIADSGLRLLYTPNAVLDHYESQTRQARIDPAESHMIERRWRVAMHTDPILNPMVRIPLLTPARISDEEFSAVLDGDD